MSDLSTEYDSLRTIQALGTTCLEWYCAALGIADEEVQKAVDFLWRFPGTTDIYAWHSPCPDLVGAGLGDGFPEPTLSRVRQLGIEQEFRRLLECVVEISFSHLFGAVNLNKSWGFLDGALAILKRRGLPTPRLEDFQAPGGWGGSGWGRPVPEAIVAQWRQIARVGAVKLSDPNSAGHAHLGR